jgi:glycosyltransferase involved in cell wall biosynthesis
VTRQQPSFDDLGRRVVVDPLFDALHASKVLRIRVDEGGEIEPALSADDAPDVIWLSGRPTWHALHALAPAIVEHYERRVDDPPVLVVECGGFEGPVNNAHAESAKEGVRVALTDLAAQLDTDPVVLWCAVGRGTGAFVPSKAVGSLQPWLSDRRALLDALYASHQQTVEAEARNYALFELLDQSERDGMAVVRSLRFRVGTRAVRLGRQLTRNEALFRAPNEIIERRATVEKWRERLGEGWKSRPVPAAGALRVTYLLPELRLTGGAIVVMQLVRALTSLGVDARVVAFKDTRREMFRWRLALRPRVIGTVKEMISAMPDTDIVVATHWTTADAARALVKAGRARHAAYYLQDYEAWFYPEEDAEARARVRNTYSLIPHKIVTSAWLHDLLQHEGFDSEKIAVGLDLGFFYPRPVENSARAVVLATARPRTPRRGFDTVVAALTRVHEAMPDAEIVLFGEDLGARALPFAYRGEGVVTDQEHLARLYSGARVHFDGSDFQAFGLPGLEAMACGTVSVLTDAGGVREYARNDGNCLLVPPRDPVAAADAILRLLRDDQLHARLRAGGFTTSLGSSMIRTARATIDVFEPIASPVSS